MNAQGVHDQLIFYDLLINSRIKMQKLLVTSNKLPQPDVYTSIYDECQSDELKKARKKTCKEYQALGQALNKLRDCLTPDNQEFDDVISMANSVMDEWYKKTNFSINKQADEEISIVKNIEQILSNKERLVRKTQTKRSDYDIIGKKRKKSEKAPNEQEKADDDEDEEDDDDTFDPEIFDDNDFYRQLLRQLIESKTPADSLDSTALSRRWLEVQKLRSKMKKKIDTKASKGRKIRYQVHNQLIGFMAPIDTCTYEEETKDALFASLFNKKKDKL